MHGNRQRVVIAGGGTAGWLAAASIGKVLGQRVDVTLIESDQIGTVGVGEATIPTMRAFHQLLGIDEQEFLKATNATFKLGIRFDNWGALGDEYFHAFGKVGKVCWAGEFQHFWTRGRALGVNFPFGDYCQEHQAALAEKFAITTNPSMNYAYHLDASLYAKFLRQFSEPYGVKRIEGKIGQVILDRESGFIQSLQLDDGQIVAGDLFLDCTGFRGLLIEDALGTGYDNWSHWLPCDSAVAVQTESAGVMSPYTCSTAHPFGWQWRIPLQNRAGNGVVYSSQYCGDEEAEATLVRNLKGKPLADPRIIRFVTGKRKKMWNKNCVALGLASGFIEPLESTSIHLVTSALIRLLRLFPHMGINELQMQEFNRQSDMEIESVRDFIVLHYHATERQDSDFWRYLKKMDVPESLTRRVELFRKAGSTFIGDSELFQVDSWTQVMIGQGIVPETYHPVIDDMNEEELIKFLHAFRKHIAKNVALLPEHEDFVHSCCG